MSACILLPILGSCLEYDGELFWIYFRFLFPFISKDFLKKFLMTDFCVSRNTFMLAEAKRACSTIGIVEVVYKWLQMQRVKQLVKLKME